MRNSKKKIIKNRTFLVTGSSSGIGLSITKKILKEGGIVIGVSREKINSKIEKENYHHFSIDLFHKKILKKFPLIDCLISNAGFGVFKSIEEFNADEIIKVINLNLISHMLICRVFVPHLKKKEKGDLIFIGSEAGNVAGKKGTVYCASKFGLKGFSHSLRKECNTKNIKVTLINPGMVKTNFYENQDFIPRDSDYSILKPKEIAKTVLHVLKCDEGSVFDEINLSSMNKIIDKKK